MSIARRSYKFLAATRRDIQFNKSKRYSVMSNADNKVDMRDIPCVDYSDRKENSNEYKD